MTLTRPLVRPLVGPLSASLTRGQSAQLSLAEQIQNGSRDGVYIDFVNNLAYVTDSVTPANTFSGTAATLLNQSYTPTADGAVIEGDTEGFVLPVADHNWSTTQGTFVVDHVGTVAAQTNKRLLDQSTDLLLRSFDLTTIPSPGLTDFRFFGSKYEYSVSQDRRNCFAMAFDSSNISYSANGNETKTINSVVTLPEADLGIGRRPSDNSALFQGAIRSVIYSPEKVSDSVLKAESSFGPYSYDVFLIAGQSNAVGRAIWSNTNAGYYHINSWQFNQANKIVNPTEDSLLDLDHVDDGRNGGLDSFGAWLMFSQKYQIAQTDAQKRILFVPCATGGTSFSRDNWNPGDAEYEYAVERANLAMAAATNATFAGILWHQGESDASDAASSVYEAALDATLEQLRTDIDAATASTPIVVGGLVPDWVTNEGAEAAAIQAIIEDTPNRISNCAYSSSTSLTSGGPTDPHFDAASSLTMGERYYTAWDSI